MVIEGFDYLKSLNNIENIDLNDLYFLLKNNSHKNYSIKTTLRNDEYFTKSSIIIFDKDTGKRIKLDCIKNYYNINLFENSCNSTKNYIGNDCFIKDCRECHMHALESFKNNKIKKIQNNN